MSKDFLFTTQANDKIRVSVFGENNITSPSVFCVHGFKGFKDWGFVPYTSKFLADNGFFVISFNFSHNGIGENLTEFNELEKFADNTFSLEINELTELISAHLDGEFGKKEKNKIGLLGHSRGGAISLLTGEKIKEISAIAIWSSTSTFDRYSQRQKEKWRKEGVFKVLNSRTKQEMKLNVSLLDDLEKNRENLLNIERAVRNLNKPLLIIHGEQDLSVPFKEAEKIYSWSDKKLTEFFPVPSVGHTFNIKHPFEGSNSKFDSVLTKTNMFFKNNLN